MAPDFVPSAGSREVGARLMVGAALRRIDRGAAEVSLAFEAEGIPSILLRGPGVARRLYDRGHRLYSDCDLLVPASQFDSAEAILRELRFIPFNRREMLKDPDWHSLTWSRSDDRVTVDLHRTIIGISLRPEEVWARLVDWTMTQTVGGRGLQVPTDPALAFILALHAASHGPRWGHPRKDLELAIERFPLDTWLEAQTLARSLSAEGAMRAGLERVPRGASLAGDLRLGMPSTQELIRASAGDGLAINLQRLVAVHGVRAKARFLAARLWPSPSEMTKWSSSADRSLWALAAAHVLRLKALLFRFPGALRVWARARRGKHG